MEQAFFFFARSMTTLKIFFFIWLAVAFAEGSNECYSDFDVLLNLTDTGRRNVLATFDKVKATSEEFDEFIKERLSSLMWECTVQQQNLNRSMMEAVSKGMLRDKQFTSFKCISDIALVTSIKLDELKTNTTGGSQQIHENFLKEVRQFKEIFVGFFNYIQELCKEKKMELEKAENEGARKRILEEVLNKVKHLGSILEEIISDVITSKFKFMEEYIDFAFNAETELKRTQREGARKMMQCVA